MLSEHFGFDLPARVDFVGGGGKTSLILRLADEYAPRIPVLYTTTTRIHPPEVSPGRAIVSADDAELLHSVLGRIAANCPDIARTLVVTRLPVGPRLLGGVDPGFARRLDPESFPLVLNEADGARSVSLKMPREGEPVLSDGSDTLVAVIGLDCLGAPLGPKTIFRWEIAAERLRLRAGEVLTPRRAASILLHPEGVCRGWREPVRLVVYINKVDSERDEPAALDLAHASLESSIFPVERVVWGSMERGRAGSLAA